MPRILLHAPHANGWSDTWQQHRFESITTTGYEFRKGIGTTTPPSQPVRRSHLSAAYLTAHQSEAVHCVTLNGPMDSSYGENNRSDATRQPCGAQTVEQHLVHGRVCLCSHSFVTSPADEPLDKPRGVYVAWHSAERRRAWPRRGSALLKAIPTLTLEAIQ